MPHEVLLGLFRTMLFIRRFEEKIVAVYGMQDMKTPVHLYIGEEAIASAVCAHLKSDDYVFTTHRSHGHCLAKGVAPGVLLAEFYGKKTGCCKGKGGSMHPAFPKQGILGTTAIVGGGIPLATGTALASVMKRDGKVTAVFFGDGASEEGTFHECMNFAALKRLPVIFVCENNFYATNSPLTARQPHDNISARAEGYGIPGMRVDGNNVLEVYFAAEEAVLRARRGEGPTLVECATYRWKGHVGPDCDYEKGCRPLRELEDWMERCPVELYKEYLMRRQVITDKHVREMEVAIESVLEEAIKFARGSSFPAAEELLSDLYYEREE
ncbi:MAG: thiamine pyrophosphate-dependent dehydrogenase E1 component subunit alpha [Nitrospirae bacterium]|nr:thiamine pyrophosphate-dependent dehydrogenase E1 component subunit alpha [Nitrospirota bacterium]